MNRPLSHRRLPHVVVIGVWLITMALALAAVVLVLLSLSADIGPSWGFRGFAVLFAVAFGTVGALINLRVPGNSVGLVFSAVGLASAVQEFVAGYDAYAILVAATPLPLAYELGWLQAWDWVPSAGLSTTVLLVLFPDGRLPSTRWRPALWLSGLAIVAVSATQAIAPGPIHNAGFLDNPLGVTAFGDALVWLSFAAFGLLVIAIVVSVASLVVRFRRSGGVERQQLKWFASAAAVAGLVLAGPGTLFNFFLTGSMTQSGAKVFEILTIVSILGIPVAAGVAILRYRLYDIDRIVSNTVGYASMTVVLFGAFALVNLALQGVLSGLTNGDALSVAVSTLAAAALFSPVRRRVQHAVDRRFHRAHQDAERMVGAFAVRLRDELDLRTLAAELATTTAGALEPSSTSVWLRPKVRG